MSRRRQGMAALVGILVLSACSPRETVFDGFGDDARKLRVVNREVTRVQDRKGVRLSPRSGNGVAWVEGTEFHSGTIEVDIRGREGLQQNYVGIAFHRKNDSTYEAVYLRPFNFRAADPLHRQHAVQYVLANSTAARSGCGWATSAAGTLRISSSRRRNNDRRPGSA